MHDTPSSDFPAYLIPPDAENTFFNAMRQWRHKIHQYPELAFAEHKTAAMVADLLREFGCDEVHEGIGRTGVVGIIRNGAGPMIGLRADMDALPIIEKTGKSYQSKIKGQMHACGHDGHTAMLLGAAKHLCRNRFFQGTVVLIFQPAEEGKGGANVMISEGDLFTRWPIERIYGMHNLPGLPVGTIAASPGAVMAATDWFEITVHGQGAHAAAPHQSKDPVLASAHVITALQAIAARATNPLDTVVCSVTNVHTGTALNVIPDVSVLKGTMRYLNPEVGKRAKNKMHTIVAGIAHSFEVKIDINYQHGYPPTINTTEDSTAARQAARTFLPPDRVIPQTPFMGAEDFSYFLEHKPGAYLFIGNGTESDGSCLTGLHNPEYDFNDGALITGANFFCAIVAHWLGHEKCTSI